jgi:hypothetical protein
MTSESCGLELVWLLAKPSDYGNPAIDNHMYNSLRAGSKLAKCLNPVYREARNPHHESYCGHSAIFCED